MRSDGAPRPPGYRPGRWDEGIGRRMSEAPSTLPELDDARRAALQALGIRFAVLVGAGLTVALCCGFIAELAHGIADRHGLVAWRGADAGMDFSDAVAA